jgi:hypothetical protein
MLLKVVMNKQSILGITRAAQHTERARLDMLSLFKIDDSKKKTIKNEGC